MEIHGTHFEDLFKKQKLKIELDSSNIHLKIKLPSYSSIQLFIYYLLFNFTK